MWASGPGGSAAGVGVPGTCGWPGAGLGSPSVRPAEACVLLQGHAQSATVTDTQAVVGQLHWHPPDSPSWGLPGKARLALGRVSWDRRRWPRSGPGKDALGLEGPAVPWGP